MITKSRHIISLLFCLAHVIVYAQSWIDVGAIVETNSHLWTLRTIERYKDSLAFNWEIKSKIPNTTIEINADFIEYENLNTGIKNKAIKPVVSKILQDTAYQTDPLRIVFSTNTDSLSLLSITVSPVVFIDSLVLPILNIGQVRYKIPDCHNSLFTRSDSIVFSDSLFYKGMHLYKQHKYQEATICFEKCYAFDRLLDYESYANLRGFWGEFYRHYNNYSRVWLAHCYYKVGLEEKAKALDEDYIFEPFDRKLVEKSDSIFNALKKTYNQLSEEEHILANKTMCEYDSVLLGGNHQRYALSLYYLGQAYSSYRNFSDAKEVFNRSYAIIISLSKDNWLVLSILDELAKIAYEEEDYVSAIRFKKRSMGIIYNNYDFSEEFVLSNDYNTLVNYYSKAGYWEEALYIQKHKMLYWGAQDQNNFVNNFHYESALSNYASLLANSGRYKDALRIYRQLIEINPSKWRLTDLGTYYYNIRDYRSALKCYLEAINDSSTLFINNCLNSLAICYHAMGDTQKAIQIQKECIAQTNPTSLASYTQELSNLASFFNWNEQYDSALVYERKSLDIKEKNFSPHSDAIAYSYMNIGIALGGKGEWRKAIAQLLFSYDICKKQPQRRYYHRVLSYLTKFSFLLGEYNDLDRYILEYMVSASEDLLSTFQELTYDERSRYIEEYSDLMNHQVPMYAYYTNSDSLIAATFNASLMMKGALLSSENGVKRVIEESKDDSLVNLWEELRADRYILSQYLKNDSTNSKLSIDSLQSVINQLEDSLIVRCKDFGDITRSMKLKWQNIQQHLDSNDIAIEFLSFPINNDSVMYAALTLRKDSEIPQMIKLFEERQLNQIPYTTHYYSKVMSDLVWKPLQPELQGIKNIYFSPSGALHNIGIEYLPGMEEYNICRLSSTRELAVNKPQETGNNAVLYGGLDYYAELDSSSTNKDLSQVDNPFLVHANVRDLNLRGGQGYLPESKVEVERIGKVFDKANKPCLLFTAKVGTEESFYALSRKKINYLHISTHGFYYTQEKADSIDYEFLRLRDDLSSAEDKSLTRSGLLMAGANHILEGDTLPDNVEDGILTAKEIANVDLRGLDLVVLSACQTGLGDIAQGEGVFGLQRGFKKAGANTILMSLWKVDDEATQILMTQFYKNLVAGQTKRQSLLSAQKYLRMYKNEKGELCYNEPKYWAAFILLDGIDS